MLHRFSFLPGSEHLLCAHSRLLYVLDASCNCCPPKYLYSKPVPKIDVLDLFEVPNNLAYLIYDGILHWCAFSVPEASDPIPPAAVFPRNYCLEIVCKLSVPERNVDMLLSTGTWFLLERIVCMLAVMLSMTEETHNRDAIVILNAFCNASEAVCYVAAKQTPTIAKLVSFIETSDQSMHQVMTHGMPALRDNPEMMGTSIGMLPRAACCVC